MSKWNAYRHPIHLKACWIGLAAAFAVVLFVPTARAANEFFPYIDTHAHMEFGGKYRISNTDAAAQALIAEMDRLKIDMTLLMPLPAGAWPEVRRQFDFESILPVMQRYPDRVRILAGPGILGPLYIAGASGAPSAEALQAFRAKAEQIASLPFISGFGEMPVVHLALPTMGENHPYEAVAPDHPMLLALSDVAAAHKLPIDVHVDLVTEDRSLPPYLNQPSAWDPNPPLLMRNLDGLERLLRHNRNTKIVWAHVGGEPLFSRTVEVCRDLLKRHPNLYMSFRVQSPAPAAARFEAAALTPSGRLKPAWAALIKEFPDRFLVGSDTFYTDQEKARGGNEAGRLNLHRLLTQLPPEVARKVARENVYRIYRMDVPIPSPGTATPVLIQPPVGMPIVFDTYDRDLDGEITLEEFVAARRNLFAQADASRLGYIGRGPFTATFLPTTLPASKVMLYRQADANGDGRIGADEFDAASHAFFNMLDKRTAGRLLPVDLE